MFYMNICALPMMLTYLLYSGELAAVAEFPLRHDGTFQAIFIFSCMQAYFINLSQVWCTKVNSPVTTSVTGQCSKIVTIAAGFVDVARGLLKRA